MTLLSLLHPLKHCVPSVETSTNVIVESDVQSLNDDEPKVFNLFGNVIELNDVQDWKADCPIVTLDEVEVDEPVKSMFESAVHCANANESIVDN